MKKIKMFVGVLALLMLALVSSCGSKKTYKVLVPNGTPLLGMSSFIEENSENLEYEVVAGSSALVAGFVNSSYDIIVFKLRFETRLAYYCHMNIKSYEGAEGCSGYPESI